MWVLLVFLKAVSLSPACTIIKQILTLRIYFIFQQMQCSLLIQKVIEP